MKIIQPEGTPVVSATTTDSYVTLTHGTATLTLSTLPRPENHSETVYLADGSLQFMPGAEPVIAAVLASHSGAVTLTIYPLATTEPENHEEAI